MLHVHCDLSWQKCCSMVGTDPLSSAIGMWSLAKSLLALGEVHDALDLFNHVHTTHGWECNGCGEPTNSHNSAHICQYCFDNFCGACLGNLASPRLTRFCLVGHGILELRSDLPTVSGDEIVFRNSRMGLPECLFLLKEQWDLDRDPVISA